MPTRPSRPLTAFTPPVADSPLSPAQAAQDPPRGTRERPRRGGHRRSGTALTRSAAPPRPHAIDLALDYHTLERQPNTTQADIARRLGRSPSAISVLCRVGEAIASLPREERAALRAPHVTYKAVQLLVSRHKGAMALREALVAFAARMPRPRIRSRAGGTGVWTGSSPVDPSESAIDPLPRPRGTATETTWTYTLDPSVWRADPDGAMADFEAFVRQMTDGVMREVTRVLGADASRGHATASGRETGRPGTTLRRSETPAERAAREASFDLSLRRLLGRVDALTKAQRAELAAFEADRAAHRVERRLPRKGLPAGGHGAPLDVDPLEVDADLAD